MTGSRQGFTLVELSIVLVILGLLVGGVLTGKTLIRAAELRSISTQHASYLTAVNAFRDKYFALPGDMTNATSFWGVAHATPTTCATTIGTGTQTCDGNGNGMLIPATISNEIFRFWQHLANAGLIAGNFSGVREGAISSFATGPSNAPAGKANNSFWLVYWWDPQVGQTYIFDGTYNNAFKLGGYTAGGSGSPNAPILNAQEIWNLDTKTDDGKPATGKMRVYAANSTLAECTDTTDSSNMNANYLLSNTISACNLIYPSPF